MKKTILILLGTILLWNCEDNDSETIAPEGIASAFTDVRDSKEYRCVTIGKQTWMAENLAYHLPMGSIEGCFTFLESLVDTSRIEPSFDDFKEEIQKAIDEGAFGDESLGYFTVPELVEMYLERSTTAEGFLRSLNQAIVYYPSMQPALDLSNKIFLKLKPKAIENAVATNLTQAEAGNGNYSRHYGFLYTYEAAQKAVPEGWRLPTDEDWKQLEAFLGMSSHETGRMDEWRDDGSGRLLKDERTGFGVTYGGAKVYGQFSPHGNNAALYNYINEGTNAYFWTATDIQQNDSTKVAVIRSLSRWDDRILRGTSNLTAAYSIRCIKK